jgi:hypothetical protein
MAPDGAVRPQVCNGLIRADAPSDTGRAHRHVPMDRSRL